MKRVFFELKLNILVLIKPNCQMYSSLKTIKTHINCNVPI